MRSCGLERYSGGETFRQDEVEEHHVHGGERGGEIKRRAVGNAAHDSTDHRTKGETEAEGGADQAHRTRAIFRRADVGDVSLRGGDVAAGRAVDDARNKEERKRRGPAHDEETDRGAGQTNDQDRPPPERDRRAGRGSA